MEDNNSLFIDSHHGDSVSCESIVIPADLREDAIERKQVGGIAFRTTVVCDSDLTTLRRKKATRKTLEIECAF